MVNKLARKSNNGTILFEPFIVYRIHRRIHSQSWYVLLEPVQPSSLTSRHTIDTVHLRNNHSLNSPQMSAEYPTLFTMARGKDDCNLHRWVLLKNSVFRSQSPPTPSVLNGPSSSVCVCSEDAADGEEDGGELEESDSFMFPDASKLIPRGGTDLTVSESEWLDTLLETLCEGEEDELCSGSDARVLVGAVEEEDDTCLSPLISPMSSSDDLLNHQAHCSPSTAVPYPVPYPPFHPPLVGPYELGPIIESPLISPPPPYDALSRYDMDELDDLSVPEAIEDTSDDESDAPSTPSLGRSSHLFFGTSLSGERRQERTQLEVYIRTTGSVFDRFELDPLPFRDEDHLNSYNEHGEC
ncbi:hypothetical protein J3R82DRAFT_5694 [Butyriboletus roseoflavus]|nr:hypothetical protein J3R82DRAFT_5694 [Butyriboletus roseoflavus]